MPDQSADASRVSSSPPTTTTASRLWPAEAGGADTPEALAAASDRLCAQLRAGLGNWIGGDGYATLLQRALDRAVPAHPALAALTGRCGSLEGVVAAALAHGAPAVSAGILGVVTSLIELLSRLIGEDMALRLVATHPPGHDRPEAKGSSNG
jgi:hypothetical protein